VPVAYVFTIIAYQVFGAKYMGSSNVKIVSDDPLAATLTLPGLFVILELGKIVVGLGTSAIVGLISTDTGNLVDFCVKNKPN
jgi:hypothetical protein